MRSGGSVLLIEGRGVVAGAGDAEDVLGGVLRHELHHEVGHVEHGAGAPGAALLADHHAAQVGQLQQEVQRSIHLKHPPGDVPQSNLQNFDLQNPTHRRHWCNPAWIVLFFSIAAQR